METNKRKRHVMSQAMFATGLPANPVPFLNALMEGVRDEGCDYMKTDEAKRILWIVNTMAYGQLAHIDMFGEFKRQQAKQTVTV